MDGPGGLTNKLYDIQDMKSDQLNDGDQLLDLQQLNEAFKKMPDLESKWIAPLGKSTREILSNIDQEEPLLQFSEDMVEKANNLRKELHRDLMFKNLQSDDFVFKDVMPLNFQGMKNQAKFLNDKFKKEEMKD